MQTAEILVPNLNVIYDERLIERGLGDWEDMPNTDEKQFLLKNKTVPPNGETFEALDNRISEFLEVLRTKYHNEKILVVTHGGVIYAIHRILGLKVKPIEGANPYIGEKDKLEFVQEEKLEVRCSIEKVKEVISKLREVYHYEEPAIDIIP